MKSATLSLILPVCSPTEDLAAVVMQCITVVSRLFTDYEIIIVDDRCDEATTATAHRLAAKHDPVMMINQRVSSGYGYALWNGWSAARGEYILAMEPASQGSLTDLLRLVPYLEQHAVVLGYRTRPNPFHEQRLGGLVSQLLGVELRDPGYRFALFHSTIRQQIPLAALDELILVELYVRAERQNIPHIQVGVNNRSTQREVMPSVGALLRLRQRVQQATNSATGNQQRFLRVQRAALGAGLAAAVGGAWLLRRWLPTSKQ